RIVDHEGLVDEPHSAAVVRHEFPDPPCEVGVLAEPQADVVAADPLKEASPDGESAGARSPSMAVDNLGAARNVRPPFASIRRDHDPSGTNDVAAGEFQLCTEALERVRKKLVVAVKETDVS